MKTLVLVLDLAGTFVFALSGAMAAVRNRLDLFGILVVSFAAATFGGMGRDLLIGDVPPAAIGDWRYVATSALAGLIIFYWTPKKLGTPVLVFDAAGLAFFAVSGSLKACHWGAPPVAAVTSSLTNGWMARCVSQGITPLGKRLLQPGSAFRADKFLTITCRDLWLVASSEAERR
jgi:uncharacterized membrane protein YeiH